MATGFPVSLLLIGMIYTSTKAIKFLSIPVYTIFKNLTIILIAYGEVLWFGGSVTPMALFSFGLMVLSSVIAAWADIQHALSSFGEQSDAASDAISTLNAGYLWMMFNCFCTATYVLSMRKRIKLTNFKDFDSKTPPLLQHRIYLHLTSNVLQQPPDYPHPPYFLLVRRGLVVRQPPKEFPRRLKECADHHHGSVWSFNCLHLLQLGLVCPCHLLDDLFHGWRFKQAPDSPQRFDFLRRIRYFC
jgi:hypothetical protein